MQGLTDKLNQGLNFAQDKGSEALSYLQSNPKITAMLLAGGGAGLLGGGLTAMGQKREGESRGSRTMRIIRNALLAGGAGVGTVGLGYAAKDNLSNAIPENTKHPVQETLTGPYARMLGGIGGAAVGAHTGNKYDAVRRTKDMELRHPEALASMPPNVAKEIKEKASPAGAVEYAKKHHGYNPGPLTPSALTQQIDRLGSRTARKGLSGLLGRTAAGHGARLGGLAGVFLPEILEGTKDTGEFAANALF